MTLFSNFFFFLNVAQNSVVNFPVTTILVLFNIQLFLQVPLFF